MIQPNPLQPPTIDRLAYTMGLRVFVSDTPDMPENAARLIEAANRRAITPFVIFFEYNHEDDNWSLILLGEQ